MMKGAIAFLVVALTASAGAAVGLHDARAELMIGALQLLILAWVLSLCVRLLWWWRAPTGPRHTQSDIETKGAAR